MGFPKILNLNTIMVLEFGHSTNINIFGSNIPKSKNSHFCVCVNTPTT